MTLLIRCRMPLRESPIPCALLEFEDHRPLYNWVLTECDVACHSQQIEFARLNLNYTVMSKRKLSALVTAGHVTGWDDPRLPTLKGLRRRGYTPASIRTFCERIGVAKRDSIVEMAQLEHAIREDLNLSGPTGHGGLTSASGHHRQLS